ncbi:alpha/beta fold hydrolase [Nonomuraea basaltis]|uniref:alpha/beta fold hydrolase n=1 Tax=Nonomuraea basaltis TaxID=2495887 RepID=UPI00110C40C4|nr:alpha/beta hydrolase [Nonomuraea basaltis]TMR96465.1 alpha/beta hydrolase [Nonomuraea basaltis]
MRLRLLAALASILTLLVCAVLYGAYGYRPAQATGYRPAYLQNSRFLDTPLARFHYVKQGTGSPVVLLSPGASWVYGWRHQLPRLAREHTVYVVDLPGQGFTTLKDRNFTWDLDGMTGAIGSFLAAAGIQRPALGGLSWSGGWALAYAQRHPERVNSLLLLAPSGAATRDTWVYEIMKYPAIGELWNNWYYADRSSSLEALKRIHVNQNRVTEEDVDAFWAPGTFAGNLESQYLLERGLDWRETRAAMPRTTTPTLVIWGRQDTVNPVWQAREFDRLMPAAEIHELDGCGHALTTDCPEQVTGLLADFLTTR